MIRSQRVLLVALVAALLAAWALRLERLGAQSLWYDETVSALLAAKPLGALVAHTARDIHPPGYYVLLHFWRGLAGQSEWALGLFSVAWSLLLLASAATFARWLGGQQVALATVALVTLSPFNIWYAQEVRMYTLGATLGLWTLMALWQLRRGGRMKKRWMALWVGSAAAGLYTLYYFAFLLLWEAIFVVAWLARTRAPQWRWRRWAAMGAAVVALWLPWLPTAFRQATEPPVPPWREGTPLATMALETLGALALGQTMEPRALRLELLLLAAIVVAGLALRWRQKRNGADLALLLGALLVPLTILAASSASAAPLYHVRYVFPFSPAFYILLATAFAGWTRVARQRAGVAGAALASLLLIAPLLVLSAEAVQRYWNDTRFAADDLRGGMARLEERWRGGDALLVNAGYAYPALSFYFGDPIAWQGRLVAWEGEPSAAGLTVLQSGSVGGAPSLGWGLAESDFYATTPEETVAALERIAEKAPRLWHFRLYDTVTDPDGIIRRWLHDHALLFHDEVLKGESNARVQGWSFPPNPESGPARPIATRFVAPDGSGTPWLRLHGVDLPTGPSEGGGWVDVNVWLEGSAAMDPALRLSVGLFDTTAARRQWAVTDEQPFGDGLSLRDLLGVQRWPARLRLPQGVPPGKYDLLLKVYRPSDSATLQGQGEEMQNTEQVKLVVVEVGPTPPSDEPPEVGTPQEATFGPLQFLGHAIPPGPWEPSASIPIELVWRQAGLVEGELRAFITSDALLADDGGVTQPTIYPPTQWAPGEVVRDIHYVTVAPDVAPGDYPLFLRVSQGATTVAWKQGLFRSGEVLPIGTLTIRDRPRSFAPPDIQTPLAVGFGESIQLVGAALPAPAYRPGETVPLTLHWRAESRPPGRYKIFAHLVGPDGNLRAQRDLEPGEGLLPTNGWAPGEFVSTPLAISLPADAPPGRYELRVGLYDPVTNERLSPSGPGTNPQDRYLILGSIEVR